jgi:hypothetical protein
VSIDDRIRTAIGATAATVREIPPLALPGDAALAPARRPLSRRAGPTRSARPTRRGRPGWGTWLIPLAAAAAVLAVAASLVAIRALAGPHQAPVAPAGPADVPRYYVTTESGWGLLVGDDRTGKTVAQATTASGNSGDIYFQAVTGAANDRTFVAVGSDVPRGKDFDPQLAGKSYYNYGWYLLNFTPGAAHPATLSRLPITGPPKDAVILGLAISPDGRTLAVMSQHNGAYGNQPGRTPGRAVLSTYAIPSGKLLHTWTGPFVVAEGDGLAANTVGLTWEPDGHTLVYSLPGAFTTRQPLRTLDTTSPASSFAAGGRAIITFPAPYVCDSPVLAADGKTVLCGTAEGMLLQGACGKSGLAIYSYAATTGKKVGVAYRYPGKCDEGGAYVLWTGPRQTAITLGLAVSSTETSKTTTAVFGAVTPKGFTQLHMAGTISVQDYQPGMIAF